MRQEKYRTPSILTFAQIYFNPEGRNEAERDAQGALEEIRRTDPEVAALDRWGDRLMLESVYTNETEESIARAFGEGFTTALGKLPVGSWQGPIESAYGLHVVRIIARTDSGIPDWTEVRGQVVTDLEYEARNAAKEQMFQEIAQQYRIVFDDDVRALMESDSK